MDLLLAAAPGVGVILFAGGVVSGLLFAMFILPGGRRAKELEVELKELRAEHEAYKTNVTGHFQKSAELFADMTHSYKAVYDHLAGGARTLCETPATENVLPFGGRRLIEIDASGNPVRETAAPAAGSEPAEGDVEASAEAAEPAAPKTSGGSSKS